MLRPYSRLIYEREERTAGAMEETHKLNENVAKLKKEYEEKIFEAQKEVDLQMTEMKRNIVRDYQTLFDQFRSQCHEELKEAQREVQILVSHEKKSVEEEAQKIVREIIKSLV